ncbi:uncharacterized protein [Diadema antillarum]|uniref:uncharacterized protein n=1 Tax=Diadema antillarum TaxID=105358 RepID=UPI003A8B4129
MERRRRNCRSIYALKQKPYSCQGSSPKWKSTGSLKQKTGESSRQTTQVRHGRMSSSLGQRDDKVRRKANKKQCNRTIISQLDVERTTTEHQQSEDADVCVSSNPQHTSGTLGDTNHRQNNYQKSDNKPADIVDSSNSSRKVCCSGSKHSTVGAINPKIEVPSESDTLKFERNNISMGERDGGWPCEDTRAVAAIEYVKERLDELEVTKEELRQVKIELAETRRELMATQEEVRVVKGQAQSRVEAVEKQKLVDIKQLEEKAEMALSELREQTRKEIRMERERAKKKVLSAEEVGQRKVRAVQQDMQTKLEAVKEEAQKELALAQSRAEEEVVTQRRKAERAVVKYNKLIAEHNILQGRISDAASLLSTGKMSNT